MRGSIPFLSCRVPMIGVCDKWAKTCALYKNLSEYISHSLFDCFLSPVLLTEWNIYHFQRVGLLLSYATGDYFDLCHIYFVGKQTRDQYLHTCTVRDVTNIYRWRDVVTFGNCYPVSYNLSFFPWDLQLQSCVPLLTFQCVLNAVQSLERMITACNTKVWKSGRARYFFFSTSTHGDPVVHAPNMYNWCSVRSVQVFSHSNLLPGLRMRGSCVPLLQGQH